MSDDDPPSPDDVWQAGRKLFFLNNLAFVPNTSVLSPVALCRDVWGLNLSDSDAADTRKLLVSHLNDLRKKSAEAVELKMLHRLAELESEESEKRNKNADALLSIQESQTLSACLREDNRHCVHVRAFAQGLHNDYEKEMLQEKLVDCFNQAFAMHLRGCLPLTCASDEWMDDTAQRATVLRDVCVSHLTSFLKSARRSKRSLPKRDWGDKPSQIPQLRGLPPPLPPPAAGCNED